MIYVGLIRASPLIQFFEECVIKGESKNRFIRRTILLIVLSKKVGRIIEELVVIGAIGLIDRIGLIVLLYALE